MRSAIRTLLLAPFLLAGCGGDGDAGGKPDDGRILPATDYLTVETGDGLVLVGELPRITIVEGDDGVALIEARGEATDEENSRLWYFYARLRPDDLIDGFVEGYTVHGTTAVQPGFVNVGIELPPGGDLELARAGTASMQRFEGWFRGQIDNADPRMAADFAGGYQVSCSYLAPNDPDGRRIVDEAFESEFCLPFAGVRPPDPGTAP